MRQPSPLLFTLLFLTSPGWAVEVASPNGELRMIIDANQDGQPTWSATWRGRAIIQPGARLGLVSSDLPALERGLRLEQAETTDHDSTWTPVAGERSTVVDRYREAVVSFAAADGGTRRLQVIARAYDQGAAVRLVVPAQPGAERFVITRDATEFALPGDPLCWPLSGAQARHTDPAPVSAIKGPSERPLTARLANDLWVSVLEADVVDAPRMRLAHTDRAGVLQVMLDGERSKTATIEATTSPSQPWRMPWRAVLVADRAGGLVEGNDLVRNLNPPCALIDTSWIRPGKVLRETTLSTVGALRCIDFAAAHGISYILFDAGWYGHEYDDAADATHVDVDPLRNPQKGPLDLQAVVKAGDAKGVGVILYVNQRALTRQLDQILPLYRSWGIKGVKYGFVTVGPQRSSRWLVEAVRKAAENHLMVNMHDEYRPLGLDRTYPNFLTAEGIRGNEEFPAPLHNSTLPFSRFIAGPADYTFCWMSPKLKVSHAHQLALTVLYYSPWQHLYWYDRPEEVTGGEELRFWDQLPTTWEETRVITGAPGEAVAIARRRDGSWWLGAIAPRGGALRIPLAFLGEGRWQATLHQDRDTSDLKTVVVSRRAVTATDSLDVTLAATGGLAVRLDPEH